jgi:hypothetical protein
MTATGGPAGVVPLAEPARLDHLSFTPGANPGMRLLCRLPSDNVAGNGAAGTNEEACRGGRGG